jgi:hypothetical protein
MSALPEHGGPAMATKKTKTPTPRADDATLTAGAEAESETSATGAGTGRAKVKSGKTPAKAPKPRQRPAVSVGEAKGKGTPRTDTKQAKLIAMLKTKDGATVEEIATAFGWQAHTVRGALYGALKKKLGLDITSVKVEGRGRVYRIGN